MHKRVIDDKLMADFQAHLWEDEKSRATIEKYLRDVRAFGVFAANREVDKGLVLQYKNLLLRDYTISSANSMLAALNACFRFFGWMDCCVKHYKVQRKTYCSEEKELTREEYYRLVRAAEKKGDERLRLILQTICGTGIRVSELRCITVEAVRKGEAVVSCKGKTRTVFLVPELRRQLMRYVKVKGITAGPCFVTRSGKPMSRCNIWREMKELCALAEVSPEKVFPHNLRHLFARIFYGIEKDIAKLADLLGHTSINTTRIYIMTTGAEHKKKLQNMRLII